MYILGISCNYHDSAAALIENGVVIAAAEEERFTRIKHDKSYPRNAICFCLKRARIQPDDLEYVVFYEDPVMKLDRIFMSLAKTLPKSVGMFKRAQNEYLKDRLWIKQQILRELKIPESKYFQTTHHMSHAASAFLTSPFEKAAILTVDGVGEWATAAQGSGVSWKNALNKNTIKLQVTMRFPHSVGLLYSIFTAYLGFQVNSGEYKVMGMAAYGEPSYLDKVHKVAHINYDGSVTLNLDYFAFHYSLKQPFTNKFVNLFGEPRKPESNFYYDSERKKGNTGSNDNDYTENKRYADIAASIQLFCEEAILKMAKNLKIQSGLDKLVMAGGVALNCLSNRRVMRESGFKEIYIQPAAGDSGGAIGAGLYVYNVFLGQQRNFIQEHNFLGASYGDLRILHSIKKSDYLYERFNNFDDLIDRTIDAIKNGKVIGWFQDRFEWGPRALGNRSILADPRRKDMKDIINKKIKFREPFRPFAPAILASRADDYFVDLCLDKSYLSRFMLTVSDFKPEKRDEIPAVCHVDGSGRVQLIKEEWNPKFHQLVKCFGEATGVPVLLNTSFNLRSEPIVNTPEEALDTFSRSGIDLLVMGDYIIKKTNKK